MDLGRFLIETHLRTGRPIKQLAARNGVSASWLFKLWRRYRLEGEAGLEPRSRRPHTSPARIADRFEDEIVAIHKELADEGFDAGAASVHYHLEKRHPQPPSLSTVFRVLKARGFVTLAPQKRPKSSQQRFVAQLPNETWQADMTHVTLASGEVYEVLNMIDDHSRLCVASRAMRVVKGTDVVRVLHRAAESYGYPASFLSDNGLIFATMRRHGVAGVTEQELFALGIAQKHCRPYHPQTCGKVERFHQTMKKYLRTKDIDTPKQLQRHLDRFVTYYNEIRPHRGIDRQTPAAVYAAREKVVPSPRFVKVGERRLRLDKIDKAGHVTLRHRGRLHHIGIGRPWAGWPVAMLIDGLDIEIVGLDGSPLRHFRLDPSRDYQPIP
ncbi:MAG TPA: IS481 family transposase [Acidimicrobiales bacterium]|nr:IS481 family transposase [Acidimicrobiales bacterium]